MTSFLITFKPSAESPERGWPLEDLQKLVHRFHRQGTVEDNWRFMNRKDVSIGDRVFLLLQGKRALRLSDTERSSVGLTIIKALGVLRFGSTHLRTL
jgi:hypothetical protein